jgi:hypothetical protein
MVNGMMQDAMPSTNLFAKLDFQLVGYTSSSVLHYPQLAIVRLG